VDDDTMSRDHAALWVTDTGLLAVEDRDSKNGTFYDGQRVASCYVPPQGVLRLGSTLLVALHDRPRRDAEARASAQRTGLLGSSARLAAVRHELERVAPTDIAVLLLGETGTGKDVAARALHALSGRAGPFQALNCATIPESLITSTLFGHTRGAFTGAQEASEGLLRAAHGGTLFLDEVDELPPQAQAALLRVLEDGVVTPVGSARRFQVDVRVLAATARDIHALERRGAFRTDLLARLDDVRLTLPPLRERREDILPLFRAFWRQAARAAGGPDAEPALDADAAEALLVSPWPYNVRALRRLAARLATLAPHAGFVELDDLPEELRAPVERRDDSAPAPTPGLPPTPSPARIKDALRQTRGNVTHAAEHLGCDRRQLYRWLKRYALDPAAFRS